MFGVVIDTNHNGDTVTVICVSVNLLTVEDDVDSVLGGYLCDLYDWISIAAENVNVLVLSYICLT